MKQTKHRTPSIFWETTSRKRMCWNCSNVCSRTVISGYAKKDIEVEVSEGELSVRSKKIDDDKFANSSIVHKGISTKCFERKFTLSDEVHVKNAEMKDGMLTIMLERIIPDHRKLKKISIK